MGIYNINFAGLIVNFECDEIICSYLKKRAKITYHNNNLYHIKVRCVTVENLGFFQDIFRDSQEPIIQKETFYRELYGISKLTYNRISKNLDVMYINTPNEIYRNPYESIVDAILQLLYLAAIDYNVLPFHGAAVFNGKGAIVIIGHTGAGKSTLLLSLLSAGFIYISDDIIFIDENLIIHSGPEYVIGCRQNAINLINTIRPGSYLNITNDIQQSDKLHINALCLSDDWVRQAQLLVLIYLENNNEPQQENKYIIRRLNNIESMQKLIKMSIASVFPKDIKLKYFNRITQIAKNKTRSFEIIRYNNTDGHALIKMIKELLPELMP